MFSALLNHTDMDSSNPRLDFEDICKLLKDCQENVTVEARLGCLDPKVLLAKGREIKSQLRTRNEKKKAEKRLRSFEVVLQDRLTTSTPVPRVSASKSKGIHAGTPIANNKQDETEDESEEEKCAYTAPLPRDIVSTLVDGLARSRLPGVEPEVFDGCPLRYPAWKAQVSLMFGTTPLSGAEKLHLIQRYLTGSARDSILGLTLVPSEESYQEALKTLDKRFGNKRALAEEFRQRLENWPRVSNSRPEEMRKLSDFIKQCVIAQKTIQQLSVLDDPHVIDGVASKLPDWCYRMWKRKANGGESDEDDDDDYPDLKRFSSFLAKEARIADHPLAKASGRPQPSVRPHIVRVTATKETCLLCEDDHTVQNCLKLGNCEKVFIDEFSKRNRLCFRCGRPNHSARNCKTEVEPCAVCGKNHATCFHGRYADQTEATSRKVTQCLIDTNLMSTVVPVYVSAGKTGKGILTYALLDSQSDTSFLTDGLAAKLGVDGSPTQLAISTMSTSVQHIKCRRFSDLKITAFDQKDSVLLRTAYTRRFIPATKSHIPTRERLEAWPHLKRAAEKIPSLLEADVGLLIGYDCPDAMQPLESCERVKDAPFAFRTPLGWTAFGRPREDSTTFLATTHRVALLEEMDDDEVCFVVKTAARETPALPAKDAILRSLEADFSNVDEETSRSVEDGEFTHLLERGVSKGTDGKIVMPLPFRYIPPKKNRSRETAMSRWEGLQRKFGRNPELKGEYTEFIEGVISRGEAEEICDDGEGWYVPHFPVWHPSKKTLRVVFDCSAKSQGVSLNDHLMVGPDEMNALSGILMRFRDGPVALTCDVKKMFHQFKVCPEDRKYLKFFWNGSTYQMTVHLFGAVSSPACATFGLRYAAKEYVGSLNCRESVRDNFYVDDLLIATPDAETAIEVFGNIKEGLEKAGLTLHKVMSNSGKVAEAISGEETTMMDPESARALGIGWNRRDDTLSFECPEEPMAKTRRALLSQSMSLFDPLGLVAPCVLSGRLLLQEASKCSLGWDDLLPDDLVERWKRWTEDLRNLPEIAIPRCYTINSSGKRELHVFTDASEKGYGACCYLRIEGDGEKYEVSLVAAKAKVRPKALLTIPRLELQAATTGSRLGCQVLKELKLPDDTPRYHWTDSTVVLGYLANKTKKFHVYVTHRIEAIRRLTDIETWRHVRTEENPADLVSRGESPGKLGKLWFEGPNFLTRPIPPSLGKDDGSENLPEVRSVLHTTSHHDLVHPLEVFQRFSTWNAASAFYRVVLQGQLKKKNMPKATALEARQRFIHEMVRHNQEVHYGQDHEDLRKKGSVRKSSPISRLQPYLDEGIIRSRGRLSCVDDSDSFVHPIVLSEKQHLVTLLVRDAHVSTGHGGRNATVNLLRQQGFWITRLRRVVDTVIRSCIKCRRIGGKTQQQLMGDLPDDRTTPSPPFTAVGCDLFGPLMVKDGRNVNKRYGVIFTCLSSRSIHIETAHDLSTDSFITAFKRLQAIRGPVRLVRSDQGTNLVGAAHALKRARLDKECEFVFNAPKASHAGGVWERQIRTARRILKGLLERHSETLTTEGLRTLLLQVSHLMNCRPLSAPDSDSWRDPPITPNLLLTGKSEVVIPFRESPEDAGVYARQMWKRVLRLTNHFWMKWKHDYLSELRSRQKWKKPSRNIKEGDVVLVVDEQAPREEWKMALVTEVKESGDGLVRTATIRLGTDHLDRTGRRVKQASVLTRPVQKLVLLLEG